MTRLPLLAVITGRPGAGKSTLAPIVATKLECTLLSRDHVKEQLMLGSNPPVEPDLTRAAFDAFFAEIESFSRSGRCVVAEAGFQHSRWAWKLEPLREICDLRIVVCEVEPDRALVRMRRREELDPERARFHPIQFSPTYEPPTLDVPTLHVDCTEGYSPVLDDILEFLQRRT
jgi:predicted kinase